MDASGRKFSTCAYLRCRLVKALYIYIFNNYSTSAELAITISYPTSASGIFVLLKIPPKLQYLSSPAVFVDAYRLPYLWSMVYMVYTHSLTAHYAHWHVGQQQSSSTAVCLWPAVGWCSNFGLSPSILSLLNVAMYSWACHTCASLQVTSIVLSLLWIYMLYTIAC